MNKLFTKIVGAALGLTMAIGVGVAVANSKKALPAYATDYDAIATFDFDCSATPSGTTSTALSAASDVQDYLNACTSDVSVTVSAKSGDIYKGKGSGGGDIPQAVFKVGKATGSGSFTFTIDGDDNVSKVAFSCYGWKTTSALSVNSSDSQSPTTAQTSWSPSFVLGTATKTISIDVTTSAVCISTMTLYKERSTGNEYNITTSVTNGTYTGSSKIAENGSASVTISPNEGYKLPTSVTVTGATSSYNSTTGVVSLSNPTGAVSVSATCPALETYTIAKTITYGTATGDTSITENGEATVTLSPNTGYKLPSTISVTGATSDYNSSTGVVILSNPTANVAVSATMDAAAQYTVSTSLTGLTASPSSYTMYENEETTITLSVNDSTRYSLPTSVTVTNSSGYEYNSSTGVITLHGAQGNVSITASAIAKPAEATEEFEFVSQAESGWTATGSTYGGYTKTVDLITVTYDKTSDANSEYWNPTRFYANMPINIVATTGVGAVTTIKTVTFYCGSSTYAGRLSSSNVIGGGSIAASTSGNNRVFTATGTVTSFIVTASSRSDVSKIEVIYDKDQSEVALESISATCSSVLVSQQVSPVITFNPAGASNKNVTYEIVEGTSSLAEVSASGVVTGLGAGTARLRITPEDTNASAITINVVVNALPSIYGVEVGKSYSATSNGYELTGVNTTYNYGESSSYSGDPSNSFPIRVVNGLYSHTVALEVTINENTKYLSWDAEANVNSLNYVDSIGRYSSWIFAEVDSELQIRNIGNYARVLTFYGGTTLRFSCYPEATASGDNCTALTFVEIAEAKSDKAYVQDFVDLYMHMTDYDQGGTQGSTGGSGWCKDGQHSYYLTAKAGYNSIIHGNSDREDLWAGDSDFAAAKERYEEWARINNDADPYDGYNDVHTPLQSAKILPSIIDGNTGTTVSIIVIISIVSLTAIGGYFFLRKRKEQ